MVKNIDTLATSQVRRDALTILEAGYQAIDTKSVIRQHVSRQGDSLQIGSLLLERNKFRNFFIIGIGKCAFDAAHELEEVLGDVITDGIIIDVRGGVLKRLKSIVGTHPLPSEANISAASAVVAMAENATQEDVILCIISGGGSALLCWPHELNCEELVRITEELMRAGATIQELNTVRKHLSDIQGGQLAKLAYPARVVSLIFSDVPGNDISMVASGPTVLDTTRSEDAAEILSRYNVLESCSLPNCKLTETPKEERFFRNVTNLLVVSNNVAIAAMATSARSLGYQVDIMGSEIQGEASQVWSRFLPQLQPAKALLGAGETTVTLAGEKGTGGRNQEMVLAALPTLTSNQVVISAASDGEDNGPYAGCIGDVQIREEANTQGLDATQALVRHDSTPFFKKVGGLIETGKTGANVSDLFIALQK